MKLCVFRIAPMALILYLNAFPCSWSAAQSDPQFWLVWPKVPPQTLSVTVNDIALATNSSGQAEVALVVGFYRRSDRNGGTAFVYDHFGLIDSNQPQKFWDIYELIGEIPTWAPPGYYRSTINGVNSSGRVCGYLASDDSSRRLGFYMDLAINPNVMLELPDYYPTAASSMGWRVSESGDILIAGTATNFAGATEVSIFDPDANPPSLLHVRKNSSQPFFFQGLSDRGNEAPEFNSLGEIVGALPSSVLWFKPVVKHLAAPMDVDSNGTFLSYTDTGSTQLLSDSSVVSGLYLVCGISEFSQVAGTLAVPRSRGKGRDFFSALIDGNGSVAWQFSFNDLETLVGRPVSYHITTDINPVGDFIHVWYDPGNNDYWSYLMHNGNPLVTGDESFLFDIESRIVPESDPLGLFPYTSDRWKLSGRDSTGFGWITGESNQGQNPDGSIRWLPFLLIPTIPGATPGIHVNPTQDLATSESGSTATFEISLASEPTADVTIGVSSSNTAEGTVDLTGLTFTPVNWDIPQTVTITGVDDMVEDGDVAFTIITAPAMSADPDYHGLDPDDVQVTNLDDDGPLTYSSSDTPIAIPDYNPANPQQHASSTINIPDDLTITGMTVNLNINHPQPGSLAVYLYGPDNGPPVPLFNVSGDNNVPVFDGISSLGDWTLEVYDTVKKKTGTLNGWSITIDQ